MYVVRHRRGLGDVPASFPQTILGIPIWNYCSDPLKWVTNFYCWSYAPSAWGQMMQVANQPIAVQPKPPQAVTNFGVSETVPPTAEQAQAAIDASLTQAAKDAQAANLAQSQSALPIAAGGCDPNDPTCNAGGGGLSTTAKVAIGLAAGVGLLVLTGSSGGRRRR